MAVLGSGRVTSGTGGLAGGVGRAATARASISESVFEDEFALVKGRWKRGDRDGGVAGLGRGFR